MAEPATKRRPPEGITVRHRRGCSGPEGGSCSCSPAHQAQVFSPRDRRTIRKSFNSLAEARAWRADTQNALRRGTMRAPTRTTLEEAADDWLAAARAGIARTRSGDPYKPSALRSYEEALKTKAQHRDRVNAEVMKDPRLEDMMKPEDMPFDGKRMIYGGFTVAVEA